MLNLKKMLMIGMFSLTPLGSFAADVAPSFASGLPEGAYRGKIIQPREGRVHFFVKAIPGCEGCFIATIFKRKSNWFGADERTVKVYKAMPSQLESVTAPDEAGKRYYLNYLLTPLGVDPQDGEISTTEIASGKSTYSDNPTLILDVTGNPGAEDVEFSTFSANSNSDRFSNVTTEFKGSKSSFDLDNGESGFLLGELSCKKVGSITMPTISAEDQVTHFADIHQNGNYRVEEKAPGVFTYTNIGRYAWGDKLADAPSKMAIMLEKGNKKKVFLINPNDESDVTELRIKRR